MGEVPEGRFGSSPDAAIGLFYREDGHMLSGKFLKEAPHQRITLATLDPLTLARLEEGVLYDFVVGP